MKIVSFIFGFIVGSLLMVIFPLGFYYLNIYSGCGSVDYIVLKATGILLILSGCVMFIYCSKIFKTHGKGTPIPIEPPEKIVHQGPYRLVRNPIYLGYFAIVIGEALVAGAALLFVYAAMLIAGIHIYIVLFEEPELKQRFGESYIEYTRQVPRWLPKIGL